MDVFVVWASEWDSAAIAGIYTVREHAEQRILDIKTQQENEGWRHCYDWFEVKKIRLDTPLSGNE